MKSRGTHSRQEPSCLSCPIRALTVYLGGIGGNAGEVLKFRKAWRRVPRKTVFVWENEICDEFFTVHRGWAYCYRVTRDGARQIVQFLLPGDCVSLTALYRNRMYFSVRALTDLSLCVFDSVAMSDYIHAHASLGQRLEEFWLRESFLLSNRLMDLGQRSGPQRVARLVLDLHHRMTARGIAKGRTFEFPLRHQHVAEASGLTAVHVSRIMSALRDRGVIDLDRNMLTIRDSEALSDLAGISSTEATYQTVA